MTATSGWAREGFAGQHLVVVPRPLLAEASNNPLLRGLQVTDAGFFPEAASHGIVRASGVETAILIVCRAGLGWLRLGGGESPMRTVGAGDAVLIPPGRPHAYGADQISPWTIQWVHFAGSEAGEWCVWQGWPAEGGVRRLPAGALESLQLSRVHEELSRGFDERHLLAAASALRWALVHLGPATKAESGEPSLRAVEAVEAWMREHVGSRVTLAGLAKRANLSIPHFSALFRKRFRFAPIDYFLRLRIRAASGLLATTEWPIGRVAAEVGFPDALYFSRCFRRVMGVSPRAFRRLPKG